MIERPHLVLTWFNIETANNKNVLIFVHKFMKQFKVLKRSTISKRDETFLPSNIEFKWYYLQDFSLFF